MDPAPPDDVMQFDHLMHWVPNLDAAIRRYREIGLPVEIAGEHPGGTHNASWSTDQGYIELIAVRDRTLAEAQYRTMWPAIDATLRDGGGALAFAVMVRDVGATVTALNARGVRAWGPRTGSIRLADGSTGTWTLGGLIEGPPWGPTFINYGRPPESYVESRAERPQAVPWSFGHLWLETPEPAAAARWLADVLGVDHEPIGADTVRMPLAGCPIVCAPGPANRISRVALTGPDAPTGEVAGLRYISLG